MRVDHKRAVAVFNNNGTTTAYEIFIREYEEAIEYDFPESFMREMTVEERQLHRRVEKKLLDDEQSQRDWEQDEALIDRYMRESWG